IYLAYTNLSLYNFMNSTYNSFHIKISSTKQRGQQLCYSGVLTRTINKLITKQHKHETKITQFNFCADLPSRGVGRTKSTSEWCSDVNKRRKPFSGRFCSGRRYF